VYGKMSIETRAAVSRSCISAHRISGKQSHPASASGSMPHDIGFHGRTEH
jgi:hypothetical protein